jgi:hypothetical protein
MAVTPNSIITPQTPRSSTCVCTTANTNYTDSPTNTQTLWTAGANGSRVTKITALSRATVTATELQLFVSSDGGTTKRFLASRLMSAYTVAQTTGQSAADFGFSDTSPVILGANEVLYAAIGVTQTGIVFRAEGADY